MKHYITALLAGCIVAVAGLFPAAAQQPECRLITVPLDRLACYDKWMPPVKPTPEQAARQKNRALEDSIAEDERVKRAMRPICKNC